MSDLFSQAGESLFGEHWSRPMAAALRVRVDTVWQWNKGRNPIPPGIWAEVFALLASEEQRLTGLRSAIDREFGPFEVES